MKEAEILPNGAKVIDKVFSRGMWTYLCYWEGQWVTWQATDFAPQATFCGSYFMESQELEARANFKKRANLV